MARSELDRSELVIGRDYRIKRGRTEVVGMLWRMDQWNVTIRYDEPRYDPMTKETTAVHRFIECGYRLVLGEA